MCSLNVICFLVQLCLILCASSADSLSINTTLTSENYDPKQNFSIHEYENLNVRVYQLNRRITKGCYGRCRVFNNTVDISCKVAQQQEVFLNVTINKKITREISGKWECTYIVTERHTNMSLYTEIHLNSIFRLDVLSNGTIIYNTQNFEKQNKVQGIAALAAHNFATIEAIDYMTWVYISSGIFVLIVLLVIIIQTWCILHYKKKAKKLCREANWSNATENTEDTKQTIRYSKMPGLKKKEVLVPESRESAIYEVLEHIRVAPEPPPLQSLPRKKTALKSSPITSDPPSRSPWGTLTLNSLLRRKTKKEDGSGTDSKTSTLNKLSTLERIKERPPLKIPTEDEVYEAVETPPPVRKETKTKVLKEQAVPKEVDRVFTQSKPKIEIPVSAMTNVATPLNSQLRQAVEKGIRLNPVPPTLAKSPVTPKVPRQNPTQPPIPKQKSWANEPQLPKATIPKQKILPNQPTIPKEKPWQNKSSISKTKPVLPTPQEKKMQEEPQAPTGSLRSTKGKPFNPGLPPPDAPPVKIRTPWGEVMPPKPKPPPPTKPKQLYPLPPTPREPEPIHVVTEYADDGDQDSDESDWMYEQLPDYNVYSI